METNGCVLENRSVKSVVFPDWRGPVIRTAGNDFMARRIVCPIILGFNFRIIKCQNLNFKFKFGTIKIAKRIQEEFPEIDDPPVKGEEYF
jgi:hypothetical protein